MISWPCERSSAATAEESTPPDMATAIVLLGSAGILLLFSQNWAGIAGREGRLDEGTRVASLPQEKANTGVLRFAQNDDNSKSNDNSRSLRDDKQERQRQVRLSGGYGFGFGVGGRELAQMGYGCRDELDGLVYFFLGGEF